MNHKFHFLLGTGFCLTFFAADTHLGWSQASTNPIIDPGTPLMMPLDMVHVPSDYEYDRAPDLLSCDPGSLKESERMNVLNKVNYIRRLHRLQPVQYFHPGDIETANATLIMVANKTLTHTPDSTLKCWTADGYKGASTSNLWYGPAHVASEQHVDGFLIDGGVAGVGHRRWLLDPFLKFISYGRVDVPGQAGSAAIKVIHTESQELADDHVDYVAYPFEDYPAESFSKGAYLSLSALFRRNGSWYASGVDFSGSKISVRNSSGGLMNVRDVRHDTLGYGLPNSLQWLVDSLVDDERYLVSITNVVVGGQPKDYQYWFRTHDFRPGLEYPEMLDRRVALSPTFRWKSVTVQDRYHLQVALDPEFRDRLVDNDQIVPVSFKLDSGMLVEDSEYFWRVRGIDSLGIGHQWSDARRFTTVNSHLALTTPEDRSVNVDSLAWFSWKPLTAFDVKEYQFEAGTDSALSENRVAITVPDTWSSFRFTGNPFKSNTTYLWHIRSVMANGSPDVVSEMWSFSTGAGTALGTPDLPAVPWGVSVVANPSRANAVVRFTLAEPVPVDITMYDPLGRIVGSPLDRQIWDAGTHEISIATAGWAPGLYLCRVKAGARETTAKLMVAW